MNDDHDLQPWLARPTPPVDLEKQLQENWQQQLNQPKRKRPLTPLRIAFASLTLVIVAVISATVGQQTPTVVLAAYQDIEKDKLLNIGISVPKQVWLTQHQIHAPLNEMKIEMTKFCNIAQHHTVHLKIAGKERGNVHIFLYQGDLNPAFWQKSRGDINTMPWRILQPRKDLSVLVLYSSDMDSVNVDRLIDAMFYT